MSTKADIKAATRRIVHHDHRTCQVTADFLGVTKGEVSYWCSDHHDRFIPVDHLMDLDAVSGDAFLKEWAHSRGYDLVKRDSKHDDGAICVLKAVGTLSKDTGELGFTVLQAAADNHFTPSEKRLIRDNIAPVKDAIASLEKAIA